MFSGAFGVLSLRPQPAYTRIPILDENGSVVIKYIYMQEIYLLELDT